MTFRPIIPDTGLSGWLFLNRTSNAQRQLHAQTGVVSRMTDSFRDEFSGITSAKEMVENRSVLRVALGAFGLEADLDNRFFVQRILEEGASRPDALANLLSDDRYRQFAEAFNFSDPGIREPGFIDRISNAYLDQDFEIRVGEQSETFRLALGLERGLNEIAGRSVANDTKWFSIMGNPPLRRVFETVFGLPNSFGTLPIDDQLRTFKDRSESVFGTSELSDFTNADQRERLEERFLLQAQIAEIRPASTGTIALQLLQAAPVNSVFT